ncbi:MFS transporter [Williamsia sp. SKLECPSW1]
MRVAAPSVLFVLVMAQPNLATGMMPLYRAEWSLPPLLVTVVFAAYLLALVPTLVLIGRPAGRAGWWWRIAAGAAAGVIADVIMASADSAATACVARVAAGLSVGLVTGSVSGLVLERAGDRGRTTMATATVLGSAVGTLAAAGFAQYLPAPTVAVYLVHAGLLATTVVAVVLDRRAPATTPNDRGSGPMTASAPARRPMVGYLSGISAWVSAGLVVALLPSYGAAMLATHNLAVLAAPVTVYLLAAWIAQRVLSPSARASDPVAAQLLIVAGVVVAGLVPAIPDIATLLAAGLIAGTGQGLAYRSGLRIVSAASGPGEHARAASRYAAVAYLFAAVATVAFGAIASASSMSHAVVAAAVTLAVLLALTAAATRRAPSTAPASTPGTPSDALV